MMKALSIPHLKQPSTAITALNSEVKITKWHKTMDVLIILHLLEQQVHPTIIDVSIGGDHFGQTTLLIAISTLSIKLIIPITLT